MWAFNSNDIGVISIIMVIKGFKLIIIRTNKIDLTKMALGTDVVVRIDERGTYRIMLLYRVLGYYCYSYYRVIIAIRVVTTVLSLLEFQYLYVKQVGRKSY